MGKKSVTTNQLLAPVAYVDPTTLNGAEYNPRKIAKSDLEQLANNISKFGFLENVVACKETNEIIGGHQRVKAALMLINKDYVPKDDSGKPLDTYQIPTTVPVIFVSGMSDFQKKALNLSLNRISGDWDYDKLVPLVSTMYEETLTSINTDMDIIERQVAATSAMMITGFAASEIADYIDNHAQPNDNDGTGPLPTSGVPKLTLEFTTSDLRDKFKAYVASITNEGESSGDALANRLEIDSEG